MNDWLKIKVCRDFNKFIAQSKNNLSLLNNKAKKIIFT